MRCTIHYKIETRKQECLYIHSTIRLKLFLSLSQIGYIVTSDDVPWCRENLPQILETENNSIALFAEDHYDRCEKLFLRIELAVFGSLTL